MNGPAPSEPSEPSELPGTSGRSGAALDIYRDVIIDDIGLDTCRLLVVGINPGLWTAKVGAPFARPGNRFWPALYAAGITPRQIDARAGLTAADRRLLADVGLGFTNFVARATARAGELRDDEIRAGGRILQQKVAAQRDGRGGPEIVMVAGIGAYRTAFGGRGRGAGKVAVGKQPETIGGAETWVVPNPSGLNAHETVGSLARAYAEVWARLS